MTGSGASKCADCACACQVASTLSSTCYSMFFLFSGFLQPKSAIPPWWIW